MRITFHISLGETPIHETIELAKGDVLVVGPGEMHSFEVIGDTPARLLAMKFPNIKDDKIVPDNGK